MIVTRYLGLFGTFLGFIVSIVLFAGVYYFLYRRNRSHFLFNSEVLSAQRETFGRFASQKASDLESQVSILQEALLRLQSGSDYLVSLEGGEEAIFLDSGAQCRLKTVVTSGAPGPGLASHHVYIFGQEGRLLDSWQIESRSASKLPAIFSRLTERLHRKSSSLRSRLATLSDDRPDVWSFLDFLYFSTITQTTVGYGDILLNSSIIRAIVILQIVIGYGILIIVLNLALSGH